MKKNAVAILFLIIASLLLVGCWDHIELELRNFVLGAGVDELDPDFDIVTEIIKVKGGQEAEITPVVLTTKGRTFFSSGRALTNPAGIRLFWAHARVFIVSEEVARQGILPAIEMILRDPDIRTSILLFVAKDCSVEDVFKSKPPITDSVSDHLLNMAELREQVPVFYVRQLWEFRIAMAESGINGVLPAVQLVQESKDKVPILEGSALFKGDRMVGWIDGEESRILAMLAAENDRGPLVVETEIGGEKGQITYEMRGNQTTITPVVNGERLGMHIQMQLQLDLSELGSLDIEYEDQAIESALENQINGLIEGQIQALIDKCQKDLQTDVFGFGLRLKRRHPDVWRSVADSWDHVFSNLEISAEVKSRIISTGVLSKPLRMRE